MAASDRVGFIAASFLGLITGFIAIAFVGAIGAGISVNAGFDRWWQITIAAILSLFIAYFLLKGINYIFNLFSNAKDEVENEKIKEAKKEWSRSDFAARSDRARLLKSKRLPY